MLDKKKQGKKNRASGKTFERKIRADLEKKGWIVDRWTNNVEFIKKELLIGRTDNIDLGKLVPCKPKFNPFTHSLMMISGGFPDFIAFRCLFSKFELQKEIRAIYEIIGVECKSNGYLTQDEKFKCKWLLENNIFSAILVGKRGKKRGEILYEKFKSD